jgi:hypothetical protein
MWLWMMPLRRETRRRAKEGKRRKSKALAI